MFCPERRGGRGNVGLDALNIMYAFLPFPAAMKAMTSRRQACNESMDGSSVSISCLAREAYSSLSLTAAWYPFGCGMYLHSKLVDQ